MSSVNCDDRWWGQLVCLAGMAFTCCACAERTDTPPVIASAPKVESVDEKPTEQQVMTLSPEAAEQLRKMRVNGKLKPNAVIRISVLEGNYFRLKNGGDKRYRYHLVLDDDPKNVGKDFSMESQGLTVLVPKNNANFLKGTEVVWMKSGAKGGFKFQNPNQLPDDDSNPQIIPIPDPKNGPTPIAE